MWFPGRGGRCGSGKKGNTTEEVPVSVAPLTIPLEILQAVSGLRPSFPHFPYEGTGAEDRGVRRARFAVLRYAEMPAVLVEAGFMTHPTESQKIYSSAYRKQLAQAITSGVLAYQKAVERPAP